MMLCPDISFPCIGKRAQLLVNPLLLHLFCPALGTGHGNHIVKTGGYYSSSHRRHHLMHLRAVAGLVRKDHIYISHCSV